MKNFFNLLIKIKAAACVCLTASVCILLAAAWWMGWDSIPLSLLFSLVLASVAAGAIQIVAFTDVVFKHMRYTLRMVVFALPFLAVLSALALGFGWFPAHRAESWVIFLSIFLIIFFWMTLGFEIFFRIMGKRYDGLLGQYRKTREGKK